MAAYTVKAFERDDETVLVGTYTPEGDDTFLHACQIARRTSRNNPTLVYSVLAGDEETVAFCNGQRVDDGFHAVPDELYADEEAE